MWTILAGATDNFGFPRPEDRRLRRRLRDSPGRLRRRARPQRTVQARPQRTDRPHHHDTPSNSAIIALNRPRARARLPSVLRSGDRRLQRRLRDSPGRLRRRARPQRTGGRDLSDRAALTSTTRRRTPPSTP